MSLRISSFTPPALLLLSLALFACGPKENPNQPPPDDQNDEEAQPESLETQTVTFGPSGGILTFADGASLEVPAYAFDTETELSASRWKVPTDGEDVIEYRFQPAGIVFARPATLRLALPPGAVNPEGLALGFGTSLDDGHVSLGRLQGEQLVAAEIVETGHAAVIQDPGVRSVIGVAVRTQLLEDGSFRNRADTHFEGALLLVIKDPEGVRQEKSANIASSGTFRFDGIPAGAYELSGSRRNQLSDRLQRFVIQTASSTLDLGETTVIRPTSKTPTADSPLSVVIESPETPTQSDELLFVSPETNRYDYASWLDPDAAGPYFGTESFVASPPRLLDAGEGDLLHIIRMVAASSSTGLDYVALRDSARVGVIQQDGEETSVLSTLQPPPFRRSFSATIQTDDFLRHQGLAATATCTHTIQGSIYAATGPVVLESGSVKDAAHFSHELLRFGLDPELPAQSTGALSYGSDQPKVDSEYFSVFIYRASATPFLLPGTSQGPRRRCLTIDVRLPLDAAQAGPVGPRVSPPSNLRVGGEDASAESLVVQPGELVLEWDAPELGVAGLYRLELVLYKADGDVTRQVGIFNLITGERKWVLSPELLNGAEAFTIRLEANDHHVDAPFRFSILGASAGSESGLIQLAE